MCRINVLFIFLAFFQFNSFGQGADTFLDAGIIAKIQLRNPDGKKLYLLKDSVLRPSVYVFLSPECPLSRNYTKVLNDLQARVGSSIHMIGIISGKAYSPREVKTFISDYAINFPTFIDTDKKLTSYMKATITPEVVFANASGDIIYRGAIDNWVEELGKTRIKPDKTYLIDAIGNFLANEPVLVKQTTPKGCYINEY